MQGSESDALGIPPEQVQFPCPSCGAELVFAIDAQTLRCPYCRHTQDLDSQDFSLPGHDLLDALRVQRENRTGEARANFQLERSCEGCGATVLFDDTTLATHCAHCGRPAQREPHPTEENRVAPDALLPFAVGRQQARSAYSAWVNSRWFAPSALKTDAMLGALAGLYLPFFSFDALGTARYRGERGDRTTVTVGSGDKRRTETRTRWSTRAGRIRRFFTRVLVAATDRFPNALLERLEPWPLDRLEEVQPGHFAGFTAQVHDVELDTGYGRARERMIAQMRTDAKRKIGGDTQRIHSFEARFDAVRYTALLLPVWMLTYRYRQKTYRVTINACTSEVQGHRPYSPWKIGLAIAAAVAAAGAAWWLFHQR